MKYSYFTNDSFEYLSFTFELKKNIIYVFTSKSRMKKLSNKEKLCLVDCFPVQLTHVNMEMGGPCCKVYWPEDIKASKCDMEKLSNKDPEHSSRPANRLPVQVALVICHCVPHLPPN